MRTYLAVLWMLLVCLPILAQWAPPPEPLQPWRTESLAWVAAVNSENLARSAGVKATSPNKPVYGPNLAAAAVDGNPKTEWATEDGEATLQLEFPASVTINGVSLVRDLASEHPWDSMRGVVFVLETSPDGERWEVVANYARFGLRVVNWAVLFPEREVRFVRLRTPRLGGRLGEFGVFRADLSRAEKWGWAVPECAYRTPLLTAPEAAGPSRSLGVNLALARGNAEGVVLPQSLKLVAAAALAPAELIPADPSLPEIGVLTWNADARARGPRWLYFSVGKTEEVQFPAAPADAPRLALSTMWDNWLRSKPLVATVEIHNDTGQALRGQLRLALVGRGGPVDLSTKPVDLPAGEKEKRTESLDLSRVAAGDYLFTARLLRGDQVVAEAQRPVFVGPVPRPGMPFGVYSVPYYGGRAGQALGALAAAETGFTEITGQYWGEGYSFLADRGLRQGLLWNPCIEPIYNQNTVADQDPAAACTDYWGERITWHPSSCYTHPEVVRRTDEQVEKWLREIVTAPGFGGKIVVDDDVHLAPRGCYNASCRELFKQVTGLEVPEPSREVANNPKDSPPPGLIPDDQPWLRWCLFRCTHIRGNLPKIYMAAKQRVDPQIQMGAVRGNMQFPFYCPHQGEYPPLFDALYDAPGSYAYLYWVRQMQDYICHGALAQMGNRGKGPWMLGAFDSWPAWILEKGRDDRWELALMKSLQEKEVNGNLYPPGALNKEVWCMLAGGFKMLHMFRLPERGARDDVEGTAIEPLLQTWGHRARAYGRLMLGLQEPVRPVAILTSISTSAFEKGVGLSHSGVTSQVLKDCLREHVPADMIAEEEILAGALQGRTVLLCPDLQWLRQSVNAAIEKWAAGGGIVISETGAAVQPAGSRAVKRAEMAATAGALIRRELECDNPLVIAREYDLDGLRYYYLVNVFTDRWSAGLANDPWVAGDNSMFTQLYTPRAQKARLRLPVKQVWDVFGNRVYQADAEGNIEVTVGPDDGMLLALYPAGPQAVTLKAPGKVKPGDEVTLEVAVKGADGKAVAGGVPLQITVADPAGADSEYSQDALAAGGTAKVAFRTAVNDKTGKWRVLVKTLVGSGEAGAEVTLG